MSPSFSSTKIKQMFPIMHNCTNVDVNEERKMKKPSGGQGSYNKYVTS